MGMPDELKSEHVPPESDHDTRPVSATTMQGMLSSAASHLGPALLQRKLARRRAATRGTEDTAPVGQRGTVDRSEDAPPHIHGCAQGETQPSQPGHERKQRTAAEWADYHMQLKPDPMLGSRPLATQDALGTNGIRGIVQARGAMPASPEHVHQAAAAGVAQPAMGLPHADRVKATFGDYDVGHVRAHHAPGATAAIGADAYTLGSDVVFSEMTPSPELVGHELTHALQQQHGIHLKDGIGATGDRYEQQADAVGQRMAEGRSATDLLAEFVGPPSGGRTEADTIQSRAVQRYDRTSFQGLSARRVVTATTLNVYATTATTANVVAHLGRGDIVEVQAVAGVAGWFRITSAQFSQGHGVAPVPGGGGVGSPAVAGNPVPAATSQAAVNGFIRDANNGSTMPVGARRGAEDYWTIVQNLANDYNHLRVFPVGQTMGPTTFRTPYVLADPDAVQTQLDDQWNLHRDLRTRIRDESGNDLKRVHQIDATRHAFRGKGTPEAVQIIAQAVVDANLTTSAQIQNYINDGPMNANGNRRNGRWGVDCSGFTATAVAEMGGAGREAGPGMNLEAKAYRPGGEAITSYGFTQCVVGDTVQAGDVVSWADTNHVVVVLSVSFGTIGAQAASTNPAVTGTKRILILTVGESSSIFMPGTHVGSVTNTRQLIAVEDAQEAPHSQYGNVNVNQSGAATWTLYQPPTSGAPVWTLTPQNGILVANVGKARTFSIIRPPSQRATTTATNLGS